MKLDECILFENEHVVVIDKPVGVLVHGDGKSKEDTVAHWHMRRCPEVVQVGEEMRAQNGEAILRSGIVHRLDRDTSGVLILAKDQETFLALKAQFQLRKVKKEYRAFVYGHMKEPWGTIQKAIGRSPSDPRKRSALKGKKGTLREATSKWQCIKNDLYAQMPLAELALWPLTGRTHQLRVHLKAIGRPIVGDQLYAERECALLPQKADRLYLHAHKLTLKVGDEKKTFTAPLPQSFVEFFE